MNPTIEALREAINAAYAAGYNAQAIQQVVTDQLFGIKVAGGVDKLPEWEASLNAKLAGDPPVLVQLAPTDDESEA